MNVVLIGKARNSPQLYYLFAGSDLTQEVNKNKYCPPGFIPPFFVSFL